MNSKTRGDIDQSLKDSFPASDPAAGNMGSERAVRERQRKLKEKAAEDSRKQQPAAARRPSYGARTGR